MQPTGRISIKRPAQNVDMVRRYRLYIDGKRVGAIKRDATFDMDVAAGEHTLVARLDWVRSNFLTVTIREDEVTEIEVGANARGVQLLFGLLYYATFGYASYLYLRLRPRGFPITAMQLNGNDPEAGI